MSGEAKSKLLEKLFGCASGPCPHEEASVVRTVSSVRMTAFASQGCRKRRLSVLLTSAMPSGAARLAETKRFSAERPFSTGVDVETEHGGASSATGIGRSLEPVVEGQRTPNT